MARGIAGYELKDKRGLQVDRPLDTEAVEDDDEGDVEGDQANGAVPGSSKAKLRRRRNSFRVW